MPAAPPGVSVCVCTYRRPELLERLLVALEGQQTDGAFAFEVVVVDNDPDRSAESVVERRAPASPTAVRYAHEPQRNISLARNRAVAMAAGALLALIDDDELPQRDWIARLVSELTRTGADGVMAPVVPVFPAGAPQWLLRGRFLHRRRHASGTQVGAADTRTGNALLRRTLFGSGELWFDPAFGRTGGEDSDFFTRQIAMGRRFVWCDEAAVTEDVPRDRWSASFHVRRLWRSGTLSGEWIRQGRRPVRLVGRSALLLSACLAAAPLSLLVRKHLRVRLLQKLAYSAGVVTAFGGWSPLRVRD
jgi:glycosyltransferase involved in cell wall biosynthesis